MNRKKNSQQGSYSTAVSLQQQQLQLKMSSEAISSRTYAEIDSYNALGCHQSTRFPRIAVTIPKRHRTHAKQQTDNALGCLIITRFPIVDDNIGNALRKMSKHTRNNKNSSNDTNTRGIQEENCKDLKIYSLRYES